MTYPAGSAGPMVRAADPVYAGGAVDRFSPKGGVNFNNPVGKRPQKRALMTRIQRAIDAEGGLTQQGDLFTSPDAESYVAPEEQ